MKNNKKCFLRNIKKYGKNEVILQKYKKYFLKKATDTNEITKETRKNRAKNKIILSKYVKYPFQKVATNTTELTKMLFSRKIYITRLRN